MNIENQKTSFAGLVLALLVFVNLSLMSAAFIYSNYLYWLLFITIPLLGVAIYNAVQKKHTIKHRYPLFGQVLVKYRGFNRQKRSGSGNVRFITLARKTKNNF